MVVEGEYTKPAQEHAYLQPEAGLSHVDDKGRVTVSAAGQWTWEDQQQFADALDIAPERVLGALKSGESVAPYGAD